MIFPEETPQDSGSDNGSFDDLDEDGGFLEPDDSAPTYSGDGVVLAMCQKLLFSFKKSC